jgi:hypothetical protein
MSAGKTERAVAERGLMPVNYILIDYENVQPDADSIRRLDKNDLKLLIFAKAKDKLNFDTVMALRSLGEQAEYILINATGSNALDFHIAFHLGVLACEAPDSSAVYVVSKDTGYDSLIAFLNAAGKLSAKRIGNLLDIADPPGPEQKPAQSAPDPEKDETQPFVGSLKENVEKAVDNLKKHGNARPRTVATLTKSLQTLFNGSLSDAHINGLLKAMQSKKFITVSEDGKVAYSLEALTPPA